MDAPIPLRDPMVPRLYLVAARAAFDRDGDWLDAIARVARAAWVHRALPLGFQVRIESATGVERLALEALARIRAAGRGMIAYLNAAALDAAAAPASALGYDGVHWPERRIPDAPSTGTPAHAPAATAFPCAASVHSPAGLQRAERAGARFALFGPVWAPAWKPAEPQGVNALGELVRVARIPVLAIGGIDPERAGECLRAGAAGVAVVTGVFGAPEAGAAVERYAAALGPARAST